MANWGRKWGKLSLGGGRRSIFGWLEHTLEIIPAERKRYKCFHRGWFLFKPLKHEPMPVLLEATEIWSFSYGNKALTLDELLLRYSRSNPNIPAHWFFTEQTWADVNESDQYGLCLHKVKWMYISRCGGYSSLQYSGFVYIYIYDV